MSPERAPSYTPIRYGDVLVAEQERLIDLLKEKCQAVISLAVTKGLNPDALPAIDPTKSNW